MEVYSNIVNKDTVRKVYRETLDIICEALQCSFGPKGSSTAFIKNMDKDGANIAVEYTKDGHTIIKNILFYNPIERSVQDLLTETTRHIVKEVGDGTTSAIILAKTLFDTLCDNNTLSENPPYDTIKRINEVIDEVNKRILEKGRECTLDDIYKIALISTNGNYDVARDLHTVYEKYGLDLFIDVTTSPEVDNLVKEYDGMTLDTGFTDMCFVNNKEKNTATIRNPKIYCFQDPIDTPEMVSMVSAIIEHNIIRAYRPNSPYEPIPTVIFADKISGDTSGYFENVVNLMNQIKDVPLLIVSDIHQFYMYEDIAKMCGAKFIKKYINPDLQKRDQEAGLAPTEENIIDFCGTADLVQADQFKTKVIRPAKMFETDENGNEVYSKEYNSMVTYLENQVEKAISENAGIQEISRAKRRLNSFKGNMIEYMVGGITLADRNNLKASVEDAVLNCRSAAVNGVGYGANFMALSVLNEMRNEDSDNKLIIDILFDAYYELTTILYSTSFDSTDVESIINGSLDHGCPLNIRTNEYDDAVLSSIKSDVVILNAVSKIISLMFTCNQYLVQTPAHNIYKE